MSFTSDVKKELTEKRPSDRHTEAECFGFLLLSRSFSFNKILLQTASKEAAERFCYLLRKAFDVTAEPKVGGSARPTYSVSVDGQASRQRILHRFGFRSDKEICLKEEILKSEGSIGAFIRGAFLAGGSISDPKSEYRIDFSFKDGRTAEEFSQLLLSRGISSKLTKRAEKNVVYIKNSEMIEDILTVMGGANETLNLINVKIYKSMKNAVNRKNNCETRNILKSADAAFEQTAAIKKLRKERKFELLSEELIEAAELRLANPEASLSELCRATGNKITRSGLNHRLKKIVEFSKEVK